MLLPAVKTEEDDLGSEYEAQDGPYDVLVHTALLVITASFGLYLSLLVTLQLKNYVFDEGLDKVAARRGLLYERGTDGIFHVVTFKVATIGDVVDRHTRV